MLVPLTRPRCHAVDASIACDARRVALRAGEMRWNDHALGAPGGGWVYPVEQFPWPPWKALPRFRWEWCPFCGGRLPKLASPPARDAKDAEADGGEGTGLGFLGA